MLEEFLYINDNNPSQTTIISCLFASVSHGSFTFIFEKATYGYEYTVFFSLFQEDFNPKVKERDSLAEILCFEKVWISCSCLFLMFQVERMQEFT